MDWIIIAYVSTAWYNCIVECNSKLIITYLASRYFGIIGGLVVKYDLLLYTYVYVSANIVPNTIFHRYHDRFEDIWTIWTHDEAVRRALDGTLNIEIFCGKIPIWQNKNCTRVHCTRRRVTSWRPSAVFIYSPYCTRIATRFRTSRIGNERRTEVVLEKVV